MKLLFVINLIALALWAFVLAVTPDSEALGYVVFLTFTAFFTGALAFHPKYALSTEERS